MAEKKKSRKSVVLKTDVSSIKPGLSCIGEVCFNTDGEVVVKVPRDADPNCARLVAESILAGKKVRFEIESKEAEKVG